jgi:hypothetical protein
LPIDVRISLYIKPTLQGADGSERSPSAGRRFDIGSLCF